MNFGYFRSLKNGQKNPDPWRLLGFTIDLVSMAFPSKIGQLTNQTPGMQFVVPAGGRGYKLDGPRSLRPSS